MTLYCHLRKKEVAHTPEEEVRQKLIQYMLGQLAFPKHSLLLERQMATLPHLSTHPFDSIPNRRADLLCMVQGIHPDHPFFPLLMIECKATPLTHAVMTQVLGYNYYIRAPFVAIVNDSQIMLGEREKKTENYHFTDQLLSFEELYKKALIPN